MTTNATIRFVFEVLLHEPFICDSVHIYHLIGDTIVSTDAESESLLNKYRLAITKIQKSEPELGAWYGDIERGQNGNIHNGWCYGAVILGDLLVVVRKRTSGSGSEHTHRQPIDGYFLNSMSLCLRGILGVSPVDEHLLDSHAFSAEGIVADLASLDRFESIWRAQYGEENWLAVSEGTVVGHGPSKQSVEEYMRLLGFEKTVLYVPPKSQSQVCDLYSVD